MKKVRVSLAAILAVMLLASLLTACNSGRADDKYVGEYTAVAGEALGYTLTGEDIAGFDLKLDAKGSATITLDGEEQSISWTNDDANITLKIQGVEAVGKIGEDTIVFDDMLGQGMSLTFAKVGTPAADPELYLPENEKAMIGTWTSYKVADVFGDDASADVAADALTVEFRGDHTATVTYAGSDLGDQTWSLFDDFGSFGENGLESTWEVSGDEIEFTYMEGDDYFVFTCKK